MATKRQPSPPKHLSPPRSSSSSSSSEYEDDDEEEEQQRQNNTTTHISTPISSESTKKPSPKKPTSGINQTPNPNSSTEEEEEEDDDDEEDEEDDKAKKIQPKPTQTQKKVGEEEESDESDSDSSSDSDLPPPKVTPVKPISSKPMESTPKTKKEAAAKPSPQKRPSAPESSDSKKRKKAADAGVEEEEAGAKKQHSHRVWSPEDEVPILNAMIEFTKRPDVSSDRTGLHEFVKNYLNADVTKSQVYEKVRTLKRKYKNNAEKARKGKELSFSKDHDNLVYELSKKYWGGDAETENNVEKRGGGNVEKKGGGNAKRNKRTVDEKLGPKSPPPSKSSPAKPTELMQENPSAPKPIELMRENHAAPPNGEVGNMEDLYPYLNESLRSNGIVGASALGEIDVKRGLELMGHSQMKEWEERCRRLRCKERDAFMERTTLVYELVKQCYDLVKSSKEL